jgi:hypothetical protein
MSYRDDVEALRARKDEIERRLAQIRGRQWENEQLAREADELTQELERTWARLNVRQAPARRSLPLLQQIYVASPCNVPWESMRGDEHVRHCGSCDKDVFDLSSLTREQAERLLIEKNGKLCVQYYRRADGTILTADCEVGVAKKKKARRRAAVAAGLLAAGAAGAMATASALREQTASHGCERPAGTGEKPAQMNTTVTDLPTAPPNPRIMIRGDMAIEPRAPAVRGRISRTPATISMD